MALPTITRRTALLTAASTLAAPALLRAQTPRKFRLAHTAGADTAIGRGAIGFADALAKLSGGRLIVERFPNSVLAAENVMTTALAQGTLEMANIVISSIGVVSDEVALADAPFLFKSVAHARACFDGALGKHCTEILKSKNIVALGYAENGMRHMTANKPIRTPADLKGLKLRTPTSQVMVESFRALGADAASYPWAELPEAFRVGRFDAQENPIINILSAKLYQWQSHLTLSAHTYSATVLSVSGDAWDEFTAEEKAMMYAAAQEGVKEARAASDAIDRSGLEELKAKGMVIAADIDRAPFLAAASAVFDKLGAIYGADKMQRIKALAA